MTAAVHPCLRCGACCAAFVVAFHWSETLPDSLAVPREATETLDTHRLAMRGTFARTPHCNALRGTVGEGAACSIYAQRPSPCGDLHPAWEHGAPRAQCNRIRAVHALAPLQPSDWRAGA